MNIYPWHQSIWNDIQAKKSKLAHAQIFFGPDELAQINFSKLLSQALLCEAQEAEPCNQCESCHWYSIESHPDFFVIDDDDAIISIDKIRELKQFFELSTHHAGRPKIALILKAQNLNHASSNALLKILEEPPENAYIFLTTNNISQILPTIRSRAAKVSLPEPSLEESKAFIKEHSLTIAEGDLEFFNFSITRYLNDKDQLDLVKEIILELEKGKDLDFNSVSKRWLDFGLPWLVDLFQKWSYDLLLTKLAHQSFYFPNQKIKMSSLAKTIHLQALLVLHKKLIEIKRFASKPVNKELNMDLIVWEYKKLFN